MSITVRDPSLLSQLTTGAEVELQDPSGKVLGVFVPHGLGNCLPVVKSPFSLRKKWLTGAEVAKKVGRPLPDIPRDLEKRADEVRRKDQTGRRREDCTQVP